MVPTYFFPLLCFSTFHFAFPQKDLSYYIYDSPSWQKLIFNCSEHSHHGGENKALMQLKHSAWRTYDPEKALLFVIPVLLGPATRNLCFHSREEIWSTMTKLLLGSSYYHRYTGQDHVIISTDFRPKHFIRRFHHQKIFDDVFFNIMWAGHEEYIYDHGVTRCMVAGPYSSNTPDHGLFESDDRFLSRPHRTFFIGQVDDRKAYADRMKVLLESDKLQAPHVFMTSKKSSQIPSCNGTAKVKCSTGHDSRKFQSLLKGSKFNFVFSGDSTTTSRLYDGLHAGSVPVLFRPDSFFLEGLPFQCIVPWADIVVSINRQLFERNAISAIETALKGVSEDKMKASRAAMRNHLRDLSWTTNGSHVAMNMLVELATKCLSTQVILAKIRRYALYIAKSDGVLSANEEALMGQALDRTPNATSKAAHTAINDTVLQLFRHSMETYLRVLVDGNVFAASTMDHLLTSFVVTSQKKNKAPLPFDKILTGNLFWINSSLSNYPVVMWPTPAPLTATASKSRLQQGTLPPRGDGSKDGLFMPHCSRDQSIIHQKFRQAAESSRRKSKDSEPLAYLPRVREGVSQSAQKLFYEHLEKRTLFEDAKKARRLAMVVD